MKQNIDVMTGEPVIQADQVAIEASTTVQRSLAGALACAAVALSLPGGVGVPAPRAESITMVVDSDEGGDPKLPRQRDPNVFTLASTKRR